MSHFRAGGLSRRRWALVVVLVVGVILYGWVDESLTLTESVVGRAMYAYTLFRSIASLVSYEEIERFRRTECSIYAKLIYGLSSRSGLGLIVEHSIGHGESQEWTVLSEYESPEIREMLG
ncbi:lipase/esterase, partial [Cryptosporidium canis]